MKFEVFKDVFNYEGLYQISNLGNVKSMPKETYNGKGYYLSKEKILKLTKYNEVKRGYYVVNLLGKCFSVHSLVAESFLNHNRNCKDLVVDHIDNNPYNNEVSNLQLISHRENCSKDRKGSSRYTGVYFAKDRNKWRAKIVLNGKQKNLGTFNNEYDAHLAYQKELNGL